MTSQELQWGVSARAGCGLQLIHAPGDRISRPGPLTPLEYAGGIISTNPRPSSQYHLIFGINSWITPLVRRFRLLRQSYITFVQKTNHSGARTHGSDSPVEVASLLIEGEGYTSNRGCVTTEDLLQKLLAGTHSIKYM